MKKIIFLSFAVIFAFISCKKDNNNNNNNNVPVKYTIKDADGNEYDTVKIGTQYWLKNNLKTTKYNDNSSIQNVTNENNWTNLNTGAYCWYNNDYTNYGITYGAIYNWYAVNTEKLCPTGWHVPSDNDWSVLTSYLGGEDIAGGKLKENWTTHWESPNTGATNESKFTALPGGGRSFNDGLFYGVKTSGYFWTSSEISSQSAYGRDMNYDNAKVNRNTLAKKVNGRYVRCVKD